MSFMANVLGDVEAGIVPTAYVDSWIGEPDVVFSGNSLEK